MPARAITPKQLKAHAVREELQNELRQIGQLMLKDFERTTRTWEHDVEFKVLAKISVAAGRASVEVVTADEIYKFVDLGTEEHEIYPVNARALAFPSKSTPKTRPGVIGSRAGGSGGDTVFAGAVLHPGTEPRHFTKAIAAKWRLEFNRRIRLALARGLRRSGHAR